MTSINKLSNSNLTSSTGSTGSSARRSRTLSLRKAKLQAEMTINKLKFSAETIYGRDKQLEIIKDTFESSRTSSRLLLVKGPAGVGKSVLAPQLKPAVWASKGFYISGKFDYQKRDTPLYAISIACQKLCDILFAKKLSQNENSSSLFLQIQAKLKAEIGGDLHILSVLMPGLHEILEVESAEATPFDLQLSKGQFQSAFRRLIRAVLSICPIVIALDDLQIADVTSLELIEAIINDEKVSGLMVIGTYRDEEVGAKHPLLETIRKIDEKSGDGVKILTIELTNLRVEDLNFMLVDVMNLHGDEAHDLAVCVHQKTLGNPFFVIQFVKSLSERDLLNYNLGTFSWKWDISEIRNSMVVTNNVLDLVQDNMRNLASEVLDLLPVIASLGATFDHNMFFLVANHFDKNAKKTLDEKEEKLEGDPTSKTATAVLVQLQESGFIEDFGNLFFHWVHDKIQEAALGLLHSNELSMLQYKLGELFLESWTDAELSENIFLVVDLLGSDASLDGDNQERFAGLYLAAGNKAMRASSFPQAVSYFDGGIQLLSASRWIDQYDLVLQLVSGAAEANFCVGELQKAKSHYDEIIMQEGRPLLDKQRAYNTKISFLAAEDRCLDARDVCLAVLEQLGIRFPKIGRTFSVLVGLMRTEFQLKKINEQLSTLTKMIDEPTSWAAVLMDKALGYAYMDSASAATLVPLIVFKSLGLTLKYGISEYTSPVLGIAGFLLVVALKDYQGGKMYAESALSLLSEHDCRRVESRTIYIVSQFVLHWSTPIEKCMEYHLSGYDRGLISGDTESACWNRYCYVEAFVFNGGFLEDLLYDIEMYSLQMKEWNQSKIHKFSIILWQLVLNLAGRSENTIVLTGEAMDQEEMLKGLLETNNDNLRLVLAFYRLCIAFFFDDYEAAIERLVEWDMHKGFLAKSMPGSITITYVTFYCALTCLSMARVHSKRKHLKMARFFARSISEWMDKGNPNVRRYDELLKAEFASFNRRISKAEQHYETAILLSGRRGMMSDQALAHQRRGEFHLRAGNYADARFDIQKSMDLFGEWGAQGKVDHLMAKHGKLFATSH